MNTQKLISDYKALGDQHSKSLIVKDMIPLVKSIVGKINLPSNSLTNYEDLESIGIEGLLEALESYNPSKDVQFNTFAYYRIRGNIIDYLRSIDELPRTKRKLYGTSMEAIQGLQQELGRTPTNAEISDKMGISLSDYEDLLSVVQQRSALSLETTIDDSDSSSVASMIEDQTFWSPDADLMNTEMKNALARAVKKLPEREQVILGLYYYEEYTLKEIASVVELSEARISQIIGKILMNLKASLHSYAVA